MTKDLGKLRMYQIMKDDSTYNNVLNKRIAKLENFKSKLTAGNIKREVSKSISLTKECHQVAESLKNTYVHLAKTLPTETDKALDQIIVSQMKAATKSKDSKMFSKQMIELGIARQKDEYEIAKQVILEAMTSKGKNDETMLDVVDKKYPDDGSFERTYLRMTIALLSSAYKTYMSSVSVSIEFIKLAEMFRGIFYMGIVEIHGGELDKKVFNDHMKDFGSEVAGLVPIVGEALSLFNMMKIVIDTVNDLQGIELPEVVKEAQEVELFFYKYQVTLKAWKSAAKTEIAQLKKFQAALM